VTHECPSELGECGLPRSHWSPIEGHPLDATYPALAPPCRRGFDDPNLVWCAGLAAVVGSAARSGVQGLDALIATVSTPLARR
jgi:hypothetical protein